MAKFTINGMDEIAASFEQLANVTDDDKMNVIMSGARVLLEKQKEKILQLFVQRSGDLADSLTIGKRTGDSGPFAYITFKGKHRSSGTGQRNQSPKSPYSGSNSEVAYVLNYGSPRIAATHWLENANEEAEEEVVDTMQQAWNDVLETKGF